jgi:hypothetical protein
LPPGIENLFMVQVDNANFWAFPLTTQFDQWLPPGRDDHAVPIADALLIVLADLRCSDHVTLGFNGPGSK